MRRLISHFLYFYRRGYTIKAAWQLARATL